MPDQVADLLILVAVLSGLIGFSVGMALMAWLWERSRQALLQERDSEGDAE